MQEGSFGHDDNSTVTRELAERADHVSNLLALLANRNRLLILCRLAEGEASVGVLQEAVGLSQSALSQHLAKLRSGGVVATRRESQTIHYRIGDTQTEQIMAALYDIFCKPQISEDPNR